MAIYLSLKDNEAYVTLRALREKLENMDDGNDKSVCEDVIEKIESKLYDRGDEDA